MTISTDLFLAILAMDSYNRGYSPGIFGLGDVGSQIGNATVQVYDLPIGSEAIGFYAIAYPLNGHKVISRRGTDTGRDYVTGWTQSLRIEAS